MSETNTTPAEETVQTNQQDAGSNNEKTPDIQELMTEVAKLKRANDKLASESAVWRKKYQSTLSEQEKASEEKAEREAEREEQFQQLLKENTIAKNEKMYLGLGWTAEEASQMAVAEYENDVPAKVKIQAAVQERLAKQTMADFLKSRPDIQYGTGNSGVTREQFDRMMADMDIEALTKFKREHPEEYARFKNTK